MRVTTLDDLPIADEIVYRTTIRPLTPSLNDAHRPSVCLSWMRYRIQLSADLGLLAPLSPLLLLDSCL